MKRFFGSIVVDFEAESEQEAVRQLRGYAEQLHSNIEVIDAWDDEIPEEDVT